MVARCRHAADLAYGGDDLMVNALDYLENELLSCLCDMLATEGRPACACHHFGGEDPPGVTGARRMTRARTARCGCAASRRRCRSAWRKSRSAGCRAAARDAVIELGIYRCISAVPVEGGGAPPPEDDDADRDLLAADRASLAQVLCCWPLAGSPPTFWRRHRRQRAQRLDRPDRPYRGMRRFNSDAGRHRAAHGRGAQHGAGRLGRRRRERRNRYDRRSDLEQSA